MRELALFAGAGGGILAGLLLGWRTVCAVELDAYCRSVLLARQRDGLLPRFPLWDDVRTFDGRPWRGHVDVVSGGFPCQDISAAGGGAGIGGERSGLWVEMARIIGEVRPRYAFVENSPMLTSRGLGTVLGDLAEMGFDARWGVLGAADVGAPHKRDRIWIVGHAVRDGRETNNGREPLPDANRDRAAYAAGRKEQQPGAIHAGLVAHANRQRRYRRSGTFRPSGRPELADGDCGVADAQAHGRGSWRSWGSDPGRAGERQQPFPHVADAPGERCREAGQLQSDEHAQWFAGSGEIVADALRIRRQEPREYGESVYSAPSGSQEDNLAVDGGERRGWWDAEPDVGRVAHGVAARVDRLRALGNGQVPAVAAIAWRLLND